MSEKHITLIVKDYINKYLVDYGKIPDRIFLSKHRLQKYEKEMGCEKIDSIYGIKICSHTYKRYKCE